MFDTKFVPTYERFFVGGLSTIRGFAFGGAGPHGKGDPFLSHPGETQAQADSRLHRTVKSVLENDGDPLGGDVMLVGNVEYGFPIYRDVVRGVLFCDAGVVRDSTSSSHGLDRAQVEALKQRLGRAGNDLQFDDGGGFFSDVRVAVGFGFRIKIPGLGPTPISLDFGFPVKKRNGDDTQVLSFSLSQSF